MNGARFFARPADWRRWLAAHHDTASELWVGFHKTHTGTPSITWPQSVDEALCFGWIDGKRQSLGESSYQIRFSPRKPDSIWSTVNVRRAQELAASGAMHASGLAAFERRREDKMRRYSFEQVDEVRLPAVDEATLRADDAAWKFFQARPPSYRKAAIWWVISAKQAATRARRLARLVEDCAAGRLIAPLSPRRPR